MSILSKLQDISPQKLRNWVLITLGLVPAVNLLIKIIIALHKKRKLNKALKAFPGPPPHWLWGNIKQTEFGKIHKKRLEWMKEYGDIYLTHLGPNMPILSLHSPPAIQAVMSTSEPKDTIFYSFLRPWIGDGLLISKGKKWSRNRRLLTPAFHFNILKPYQALFSQSTNTLIKKWEKILKQDPDSPIEMFQHISLMTLDSLMKCIFGMDRDYQNIGNNDPYIRAVYEITELVGHRARNPLHHNDYIYYFSYNGYRFRKACKLSQDFSNTVISMKREARKKNPNFINEKKYLDFLDMLLECRDSDGKGLTHQEIQDEVDTFMFEGHDTTASALSWCLYNIASHPDNQERCREEVADVLGGKDHVEWEDLSKLTYLTMCIKESLRTHPPVPAIGRTMTETHTLYDGRVIPVGVTVGQVIYSCHMNPEYWPNPTEYSPDRFSLESSKDRHPYAFIPFSAGPRNCIGQNFAMNELKTVMALLLKTFYFHLDETRIPDEAAIVILKSNNGIWLKLSLVGKMH